LSLEDGAKTTRLVLRQGTASFYVNPGSEDYFSVTGGDFTVEADGRAGFRLDNFDDGFSVVDVTKGRISVLRKELKQRRWSRGQSLSMRAGATRTRRRIARLPEKRMTISTGGFSGREDAGGDGDDRGAAVRELALLQLGFVADLYTYGSWYPVSGYGNCWAAVRSGGYRMVAVRWRQLVR